MRDIILSKLKEIEKQEQVRIILAVESGSRAWGFASIDSDYDVRFLYVRKKEEYLKLEGRRDVLEYPIDDALDINGWDIDKALRLLHASNPVLFEWLHSPVVYRDSEEAEEIRELLPEYFSVKKSLHHYLSMSVKTYRESIKGKELIKAKKYFYAIRPLLAAEYILETGEIPPVLFETLRKKMLPEELDEAVDRLLDIKIRNPETKMTEPAEILDRYIEEKHEELLKTAESLKEKNERSWEALDKLYLRLIDRSPVLHYPE